MVANILHYFFTNEQTQTDGQTDGKVISIAKNTT